MSNSLNPEQQRAVEHVEGPLLILAGAGSGKTRVLTQRIASLIGHGVPAQSILALTFTNKAAREMRERVERIVPSTAGMWITTFHSAGLRLMREYGASLGLPRDFVIYDDSDQQKLLRDILRELNIDEKKYTPRSFSYLIGKAKDLGKPLDTLIDGEDDLFAGMVVKVAAAYRERMQRANAFDFGDLLTIPNQWLEEHPQLLERLQQRFQYLLIDEYQDTNHVQYQMAQRLAAGHQNICVVGDPDQSIYAWRGADIQNILSFERDYPNASVVCLEQNYRSTQTILSASNAVIKKNSGRRPKELWTDNGHGERIVVHAHENDLEEAGYVARKIYQAVQQGKRYQDIAIFYRVNAQSRVFEEAMRRAGIPYKIFGGLGFYERREVKDLLSYLRLLVNPHDSVSLARIINVPARGIGKTTVDRLVQRANSHAISLHDALASLDDAHEFTPATKKKLMAFYDMVQHLRSLADGGLIALWDALLERTGYLDAIRQLESTEAADRLENIEELGRALAEVQHDPTIEGTALQQFLDQVSLVSQVDGMNDSQGTVNVMTLHLAKGLEFPYVFMVGLEEGLFPHSRSLDDETQLEEERRLCYVGMTRAMEQLYMCHAERRRLHGREQYNVASRFLDEIPEEFIAQHGRYMSRKPCGDSYYVNQSQSAAAAAAQQSYEHDFDDFDQTPESERVGAGLQVGLRVAHAMFGPGIVRKTDGHGDKQKVVVQFDRAGIKTLMVQYANLNVLS